MWFRVTESGVYAGQVQHALLAFMIHSRKLFSRQEELHKISRLNFIFMVATDALENETVMVKTLTHRRAKNVSPFEKGVFINCPFDKKYEPILQAILFCVIYLGFAPRIATESNDSSENRLRKIQSLIEESKYSIHDLSRCISIKKGEFFRLNMPFELGVDYGCREYSSNDCKHKKFLILEEKQYQTKKALSDLAGCDMQAHDGDYAKAIRKVRNWLVSEANLPTTTDGAAKIIGAYTADFQEWHYEQRLSRGFSEEDIQDYPTSELLGAMHEWTRLGRPASYQQEN